MRSAIKEGIITAYEDDLFTAALNADVVSEDEVDLLRETEKAVRRAIDVDDFSSEELWSEQAGDKAA